MKSAQMNAYTHHFLQLFLVYLLLRMFDVIAEQYDVFNRYASMGRDNKWRAVLVDNLEVIIDDQY